jgi:hypothetical protein
LLLRIKGEIEGKRRRYIYRGRCCHCREGSEEKILIGEQNAATRSG